MYMYILHIYKYINRVRNKSIRMVLSKIGFVVPFPERSRPYLCKNLEGWRSLKRAISTLSRHSVNIDENFFPQFYSFIILKEIVVFNIVVLGWP